MRTTITIDDDVLAVARALAVRKGSQPGARPVRAGKTRFQGRREFRGTRRQDYVCRGSGRRADHQRGRLRGIGRLAVTALLDVNVLIALAWPNHVHHAAARDWFERHGQAGWATCTLTEAGFVSSFLQPIGGPSPRYSVGRHHGVGEAHDVGVAQLLDFGTGP